MSPWYRRKVLTWSNAGCEIGWTRIFAFDRDSSSTRSVGTLCVRYIANEQHHAYPVQNRRYRNREKKSQMEHFSEGLYRHGLGPREVIFANGGTVAPLRFVAYDPNSASGMFAMEPYETGYHHVHLGIFS